VTIDRILGDPIILLGYAPETTIAEKGVTILERGITSTRWRDYVDIVQLARQGIDPDKLLRSAQAAARHRGVTLEPVTPYLAGYGAVAQAKWAARRRKEHLDPSARRTSTTRSHASPPTSIPCLPKVLRRKDEAASVRPWNRRLSRCPTCAKQREVRA
jgi:hypothetical protein